MKKITLLLLTLFLSFAGYSQFPTPGTEGFEGTTGPNLPAPTTPSPWTLGTGVTGNQWAVFDNGVGLGQRWGINNAVATPPIVYAGTNAAYINRENIGLGNTSEDYLATPLITVPTNGQLRFFSRTFSNGNTGTLYQVKVAPFGSTQNSTAAYTTLLAEYTEDQLTLDPDGVQNAFNVYTEKVIDFPASMIGQQVYVSFVMKYTQTTTGISGDRWLLDNVRIAQKCLDPTTLTATGIVYNGATLNWANPSGATSWEIEIVPIAAAPTGTGTVYNGTLPYVVTGLTPNTAYKYYVRALCGDGINSDWVGPQTFTTPVAPPICGGNYFDSGLATGNYTNNTDSTITICPVTLGDVVTVTFTSFNTETNADGMYVFNGNTTSAPQMASTNPAGTVPGGLAGSYWGTTIPGPFTSSSPDGCLTFRFRSGAATVAPGWTANITCGPPPPCSEPISVTRTAITATSVTLGWTNTNAATEWHVLALPCGSPTPDATATGWVTATTNPFVLSTLNPDTCYDFYVRAVCSSTDISDWTSPVSATTQMIPPACGGTFSDAGGSSGNYANNSNVITTICPTIPGDVVTVTFTSFNTQATADGLYIFNGNSITAPLMSSGNPAGTVPGAVPGAYWGTANPGSFTSSSPDGCLTFRFRSGASTNAAGWTSNVTCAAPPTCPQPQSLLTSAVTYNSVNLSWTENGTATAWQVLALPCGSPFPTAGATGWVSASTNPFTLGGLTSETCYDIYVRSECSTSDLSTWIGPRTITTLIAPPLCGGPFVDNGGASGFYLNNSDVTYTVCPVNAGDQVTVTFTSFNLQATADGLYVFDGNSIASEQISSGNPAGTVPGGLAGAYWGTTIPEPFTSTSPDGCLTFRFRSGAATNADGWVANVTCNPAPSCLRPNNVSVSAITTNSATVAWNETGTATTWHVLMLPVGAPTPDATTPGWQTATTNPYLYTPLSSGTQYKVYVRSECSTTDVSLWSNPKIFNTLITNDECATATVAPVNTDSNCGLVVGGTVIGATASPQTNGCGGTDDDDVWFQFTATATAHTVSLLDITGSTTDLFHVVYSGSCGTLTQLYCSDANTSLATALVPGQIYYIRVYTNTATTNQTSVFNLCVGTVPPPISTSTGDYTQFQLIEDVLLNSTCANVGNVTWSTGTNFGSVNGIGYFNKNGSDFPFDEGVVLTSGSVVNVPGPNDTTLGEGTTAWTGDADLEAIILAATGAAMNSRNASKLEFDFTPLSDSISFRFIFASEEYGTFQCSYSDAFAFLLTDITPGVTPVTSNLALIPGTTTPISVVTIRDALYNAGCASVNPEYFAAFYGAAGGFGPFAAPIDYNGVTVPMTASATVIPGHQYHIKLVVADRSDTAFDSAVFLEGGSFDIGNVDLGNDFLEANGTALCPGQAYIIQSGLDPDDYTFEWSNGSGVIAGQTGPNLTITEEGTYSVSANFIGTTCIANDSLTIEYYEGFTAGTPVNLTACNNMLYNEFDLSQNNANALGTLNPTDYTVTYHATLEDAQDDVNILPTLYTNITPSLQTIYVRVESNLTGCNVISPFNLVVQDLTPQFIITPDLTFCAGTSGTITVTPLNYNTADVTFSWSLDGTPLPDTTSSITITAAGIYEVVVNNSGCIASDSTTASITPIPVPDAPTNVVACDSYTLPALTTGNYYTATNGGGTMLNAGHTILLPGTTTLYVYAESGTTPNCTAENSFTVTINTIDAQVVSDVTACDSYTLPALNANNSYYTAPSGGGMMLNAGDVITSSQTIYVLAQSGTTPNCTDESSFIVTINTTPTVAPIANVTACDSYTLPAVAVGNYYTAPNGGGIMLPVGTVITTTQTIYCYASTGTIPNCSDEESFIVTINSINAQTLSNVTVCDSYVLPALNPNNNYYTAPNGGGTMLTAGSLVSTTGTIYILAQTGTTPNCTDESSFTVTINTTPDVLSIANVTACDSYTLPALSLGNYYTSAGGVGPLAAGTVLSTTQTIYVYASTGTTPNCFDEESFTVTISSSPQFTIEGGCEGGAYVLEVIPTGFLIENATYQWTNSSSTVVGTNSSTLQVSTADTYSCQVTIGGCSTTEEFAANDIGCMIPKGISPNGDEFNQSFDLSGFNVKQLSIYNRYGTKVYSKKAYTNQWEGQSDAGEELPDGTYYYVVERDGMETLSGWVYINRER